jgi:tetratricopeptide (TPR) repeat protein
LGWVFYKMGRTAEALPPLRHAIELLKEPDDTVFDHLADVLLKLGKKEEAITYLKRAVASNPKNQALAEKLKTLTAAAP